MRIETLLNRVFWIKSFIYAGVSIQRIGRRDAIVVDIRARQNGLSACSRCGKAGPVYDHMPDHRQFEFIPQWNIPVYFHYTMRRVDCEECGVRVERVPWAEGKSPVTKPFALFLARWAKRLSWKETAKPFCTTWDTVFRSVKQIVEYGLKHRQLDGIAAIGVDEIQYGKGHSRQEPDSSQPSSL